MSQGCSSLQPSDEQSNLDWKELDELLEDLPSGIPILTPEDAGNFAKYTNRPAHLYSQGDGWKNCARALEEYDAELCKGYREEIDTLLVFAGLFSAVVTAFAVESYQWLQTDANDAVVVLLSQIAQSVTPNSSAAPLLPASAGLPGSVSIRINVYWFLALALSLSAALVAILCKQWIREFERNMGLTPKQFVGIHQTKLEGLENWRVGGIISLLPLLLQLALAVFALGILELLWHLHSVVAIAVCVPTFVAFLFYGITTVLPALQYPHFKLDGPLSWWQRLSECPYKSPQAMLAFRARDFLLWLQHAIASRGSYVLSLARYHIATGLRVRRGVELPYFAKSVSPRSLGFESWHVVSLFANYRLDLVCDQPDHLRPTSLYRSLRWIVWNINDGDITEWIWHCVWETATARDPGDADGEDAALRQALHHVSFGSTEVPASGVRALALGELTMTNARHAFVVEAFVQNLALLDPAGAAYLAELLAQMPGLRLDLQAAASILRAAAAYARARVREAIGTVLLRITALIAIRHDAQWLCDGMLVLYLSWLRAQPAPYDLETVATSEKTLSAHFALLLAGPEDYAAHPRLLRQRPHVRELAALLQMSADMVGLSEDPDLAAALAARLFPSSAGQMQPIVRELLDIAAQDDSDRPVVSPPSSPYLRVHFQGARTERGLPAPTLRNSARNARQPDAYPVAAAADAAAQEAFASGDSDKSDDTALRAVVVHSRGSISSGRRGETLIVDDGAVGILNDRQRAERTDRDEPALPASAGTGANG